MPSTCRRVRWCVSTFPTVRAAGRARSSPPSRTTRSRSRPAKSAPSRRAPSSSFEFSAIWAGIAFDNNGGATGATAAQLDNLAQGIFSPPDLGTSADQYFVTTAAGSFAVGQPGRHDRQFRRDTASGFRLGDPDRAERRPVDHQVRRRRDGPPGGNVVYTITASNAGPDHGVRCARRRYLPRLAHLQLDLRGQRRQHLRREWHWRHQRCDGRPGGRRQRDLHGDLRRRPGHRYAGEHGGHLRAGHRGGGRH